jgi:predicted small metal-binding protein
MIKSREMVSVARKMVDCRKVPSDINCTLTIAGNEDELLEAAVGHAVAVHGDEDTPELRQMIRSGMEDVEPALA